jgi:hypothetical protein
MGDLDEILVKDRHRYLVLRAVYDISGGNWGVRPPYEAIVGKTGLSREQVGQATGYLAEEGLIDPSSTSLGITHRGLKEIEASIKYPNRETDHFSVQVFQFNAPVGAVQTGQGHVANVTQNISGDTAEALRLIAALRGQLQALPDAQRQEAKAVLEDLESDTQSTQPRPSRITSSVLALLHLGKDLQPWVSTISGLAKLFGFQLPPA